MRRGGEDQRVRRTRDEGVDGAVAAEIAKGEDEAEALGDGDGAVREHAAHRGHLLVRYERGGGHGAWAGAGNNCELAPLAIHVLNS